MIKIYTDGAYSIKNKQGGVSWAIIVDDKPYKVYSFAQNGGSNNTAELSAVILALSQIRGQDTQIQIITDSMYVVGCGWKNWVRKTNRTLWELFDVQINRLAQCNIQIDVIHVRGHQAEEPGHSKWNNFVDFFAQRATQK